MNKDLIFIDIRSEYDYQKGHIPNSLNIPSNQLISNPRAYLNKEKKYCIYCKNGYTSTNVVNRLNFLGYNTFNLEGGYTNYKKNH